MVRLLRTVIYPRWPVAALHCIALLTAGVLAAGATWGAELSPELEPIVKAHDAFVAGIDTIQGVACRVGRYPPDYSVRAMEYRPETMVVSQEFREQDVQIGIFAIDFVQGCWETQFVEAKPAGYDPLCICSALGVLELEPRRLIRRVVSDGKLVQLFDYVTWHTTTLPVERYSIVGFSNGWPLEALGLDDRLDPMEASIRQSGFPGPELGQPREVCLRQCATLLWEGVSDYGRYRNREWYCPAAGHARLGFDRFDVDKPDFRVGRRRLQEALEVAEVGQGVSLPTRTVIHRFLYSPKYPRGWIGSEVWWFPELRVNDPVELDAVPPGTLIGMALMTPESQGRQLGETGRWLDEILAGRIVVPDFDPTMDAPLKGDELADLAPAGGAP
jgi:hypothetical protein